MSAPAISACELRRPIARDAPWWTTTRRPGAKRAASAAQLPTTAAGAMTSAGAVARVVRARWASTVGVLPRPMSSARHPPSSAASRNPIHASASAW